jgi:hypothetical protein
VVVVAGGRVVVVGALVVVVVSGGWVAVMISGGCVVVVVDGDDAALVVGMGPLAACGAAVCVSIRWIPGVFRTCVAASFPTDPANTAAATRASSGYSITTGSPIAAGPEGVTNAAKPMIADVATTAIVVAEETERCLETRRRYVPSISGRLPCYRPCVSAVIKPRLVRVGFFTLRGQTETRIVECES